MAISQDAILVKWQSPKFLLLLHFFMNLSETFRIDVNMDFANNLVRGFLIMASKKILSPKSKKTFGFLLSLKNMSIGPHFFGFWAQFFVKALMKNPRTKLFAKIYIDSESFRQIHGKM